MTQDPKVNWLLRGLSLVVFLAIAGYLCYVTQPWNAQPPTPIYNLPPVANSAEEMAVAFFNAEGHGTVSWKTEADITSGIENGYPVYRIARIDKDHNVVTVTYFVYDIPSGDVVGWTTSYSLPWNIKSFGWKIADWDWVSPWQIAIYSEPMEGAPWTFYGQNAVIAAVVAFVICFLLSLGWEAMESRRGERRR